MNHKNQIIKFSLLLACLFTFCISIISESSAHTRWNYYRYNYECRSEEGRGPIVADHHCRTPNHTQKVCRSRDRHTHTSPRTVEGPGYIDTDGDGVADTQITDVPGAAANCPCTTVSDPGMQMNDPSAASVAPTSESGTYTRYQTDENGTPITNENGNLIADNNPIHEYDSDDSGSGSPGNRDMTADDWSDIIGD